MICQFALLAILFADKPPALPDFVEFRIRDGIAAEDRRMLESILKQRRRAFDRIASEVEDLQAAIPRVKGGPVWPGLSSLRNPAADANGDWYFANREMKAATANAYNTRLGVLRKRLENYAVDPAFTTPFVGRPSVGTIGYLARPMRVVQVVTEIEILLDGGPAGPLWIEGIDAREIAGNQALTLPWAFYVVGTTAYIDALGATWTVPRLRRFDMGRFIE